jgi:hypothetical protein
MASDELASFRIWLFKGRGNYKRGRACIYNESAKSIDNLCGLHGFLYPSD